MSKLARLKGQNAHLEARAELLAVARNLEKSESETDVSKVFASAVVAYLEAEEQEPCLHLHDGKHVVGECGTVCAKELGFGLTCTRQKGHRGAHTSKVH